MPSLHRTEGTKELLICESLSCHPLANYFSIPGRVTSSPVLHGKNKKLTASIKNVFLWLGIRNICRNELDIAARVWDKSFSNWEARHECGFEVLLLFESSAVVTVTCLWLFYHAFWKKRWAIFIIGSEKKVLKDTFINVKLETVLFTNFWSLASHKFTSWRPFKGPKWKTLLCRMSSCPKGLFLSLSRNTSHIQFILLPESPAGGKKRIWSLPLCYTCQLVMEILIATIKYFSKTCPQIHYHSCRSGSWERAINLEEGL